MLIAVICIVKRCISEIHVIYCWFTDVADQDGVLEMKKGVCRKEAHVFKSCVGSHHHITSYLGV